MPRPDNEVVSVIVHGPVTAAVVDEVADETAVCTAPMTFWAAPRTPWAPWVAVAAAFWTAESTAPTTPVAVPGARQVPPSVPPWLGSNSV
jgi:hypothetical protein